MKIGRTLANHIMKVNNPTALCIYCNELILFVGKFFSFMQQQTIATREEDLPQYHNMEDPLGGLFVLVYAAAGMVWNLKKM